MTGKHHAITGLSGWALTCAALAANDAPPTLGQAAVGAVTAAGAALVPDIDEPGSTVSNSLGVVTRAVAWVLGPLLGAHRTRTHYLVSAVAAGCGVTAVCAAHPAAAAVVVAVLAVFAGETAGLRDTARNVAAAAAGAALVGLTGPEPFVVGVAVTVGWASHLLGDTLTPWGTPLFWPVVRRNVTLNLFSTGAPAERVVVWLVAAGSVAVAAMAMSPSPAAG